MQTLTMQGIADLARVQRPVVSMWRSRFADSERPFPAPTSGDRLLFDAAEVSRWLADTGRGSNSEAALESSFHSSAVEFLTHSLDHASALLLLHDLRGEPFGDSPALELMPDLEALGAEAVLDPDTALSALADVALRAVVDEVAEAAFSGRRVLDDLVDGLAAPGGPWAAEALTSAGADLLGGVIAQLHHADPRVIAPVGSGGLLLASAAITRLGEHESPTMSRRPDSGEPPADLAAWRRLAAHGATVTFGVSGPASSLYLIGEQAQHDGRSFFDHVEDALVNVGPRDVLLVVGPARLMTDPAGATERRRLLVPSEAYTAPLRYVARLPKGLSRFGGRRRLALWVFGRPGSPWTVVGAHSDTRTGAFTRESIAADVVAAITDGVDVHTHAFDSSSVRASDRFCRQDSLTAAPTVSTPRDGGAILARVWELDAGLLSDVGLAAADARPRTIPFAQAARRRGRDAKGSRIPHSLLGAPAAGSATVIGADEVRDPSVIGRRAIDRLTLEEVAPRARLTRPGDVVYVATGGPAAIVDEEGGHVVLAPARVFRCRDAEVDDRQLVPAVVADDIAAQTGSDRSTWRLRTVPVDRVTALDEAARRIGDRERELRAQLHSLGALRHELIAGFASGALTTATTHDESR